MKAEVSLKKGIYEKIIKRIFDFILSLIGIIILSPILLLLTMIGAVVMKGNPFFVQERPGKNEKIFKMIKFRSMSNAKDKDGNILPDAVRLNKYGRFLRSTSLDELPELFNIICGNMSIVGPRPLLPEYLPYYTDEEKHRHDVRPGLTGLAQINGRNSVSWEQTFQNDIKYVNNITFIGDVKIVFATVYKVINKSDIVMGSQNFDGRLDVERKERSKSESNGNE